MNARQRVRAVSTARGGPERPPEHSEQRQPSSQAAHPKKRFPRTDWSPSMQNQNTPAWVTFTYISFGTAAAMLAMGIWALPTDLWVKGYLSMAGVFLTGSCFTLAKTLRDEQEAKRFTNRIEEAKTEKLLMGIE